MATTYRIHPGIGIARLGNSPEDFCITPEEPAALPLDCDAQGNPLLAPDGQSELRVKTFKDGKGRIKRQAARFQLYVYDDDSPEGRPLRLGDPISGGGNDGVLVDVQWRVYLANKKSSWYEFQQLDGEHGYDKHPRRNADITDPEARQRLIIDPGPRIVDCQTRRTARFDRDCDIYAPTFPPPLEPKSIDTLGEIRTDNSGRLLVLGGHGNAGTFKYDQFSQPRIDTYANNDGWFDDTSDGPVMARLVMYSKEVEQVRFVDVEYPAWVIVGYPAYVPQILDMVTMDEVVEDLAIRELAYRTDLYGEIGTFADPQVIDRNDPEALVLWRAGRLEWNATYKPWFYRDVWPILFRPDEFTYLSGVLGQSNYPHNQSARGRFDPNKLSVPPMVDRKAVAACEKRCIRRHHSGELFVETLGPALTVLEKQTEARLSRVTEGAGGSLSGLLTDEIADELRKALSAFAQAVHGDQPGEDFRQYLKSWRAAGESSPGYPKAKDDLERKVQEILAGLPAQREARWDTQAGQTAARAEDPRHPVQPKGMALGGVKKVFDSLGAQLRVAVLEHLRKHHTGKLLEDCRRKCIEANTYDPYHDYRTFLFNLLRQSGEENQFGAGGKASSRTYNLPLMPLLAGDNPISNMLSSKFLRLTEYQYFLLRQWANGLFYNEELEGWSKPDPWQPYAGWVNKTGRDLDRGVLSNVLGGAFCPGGEAGWILRNPSVYREPFRIKADPDFFEFRQTAAQANAWRGGVPEADYVSYVSDDLSQDNNFDVGLQPGDLTKYMALPWQADFNECTTQLIDITYEDWNVIDPDSDHDSMMKREQRVWETLWWPAHRPLQTYEVSGFSNGKPSYIWVDWSRGIPGTNAGDLKMVTEWWRLGFVVRNPYLPPGDVLPTELPPDNKYISVERTERAQEEEEV
jgi:hypothetical protein